MTGPPIYHLRDLGPQAQMMAKDCPDKRLAMTLHFVAIGSMVIMAAAASVHLIKDLFKHSERDGRSR
jgi:hypothetical protein